MEVGMKNKVLVSFILMMFAVVDAAAQKEKLFYWPVDTLTHKFSFRGTVYLRGYSENVIFKSAKTFGRNNFYKPGEAILAENDSLKTVLCKGVYPVIIPELQDKGKGYVAYKLLIECFDNGYLYTITDFEHFANTEESPAGGALELNRAAAGGLAFPNRYWDEVKAKCFYNVQTTIEQLKEFMQQHTKLPSS